MTKQEIDHIERAIRHIESSLDVDSWAMEIAVEAMRKQIPQKPIEKPEKHNKDICKDLRLLYCPSCENWIGMWHNRIKCGDMYNNYNSHICPYCGQAIEFGG